MIECTAGDQCALSFTVPTLPDSSQSLHNFRYISHENIHEITGNTWKGPIQTTVDRIYIAALY